MSAGGFINVGMVFDQKHNLVRSMNSVKDFLSQHGSNFLSVKYSKDIDGENWIEENIEDNVLQESYLTGFYNEFEVSGKFLDTNKELNLSIIKEDNYFGLLFNIEWEEMSNQNFITFQTKVVNYLIEIYRILPYEYSFVGHEIEIEMDPEEFVNALKGNDSFPVAIIGKNVELDVYYGSIGIDGFSSQAQRKEVIKI